MILYAVLIQLQVQHVRFVDIYHVVISMCPRIKAASRRRFFVSIQLLCLM
jgi:hypothetical protein